MTHALGTLPSLCGLFLACGWGVAAAPSSRLLLVRRTALVCRKHPTVSICGYYCWFQVVKWIWDLLFLSRASSGSITSDFIKYAEHLQKSVFTLLCLVNVRPESHSCGPRVVTHCSQAGRQGLSALSQRFTGVGGEVALCPLAGQGLICRCISSCMFFIGETNRTSDHELLLCP